MAVGVSSQAQGSGTTVQTPLGVTTSSGSTIVVYAIWTSGLNPTISDTLGSTFTPIAAVFGGPTAQSRAWYVQNIAGMANYRVTSTTAGGFLTLLWVELTGMQTSGVLDQSAAPGAVDNSSPFTSSNITTTSANEVVVGMFGDEDFNTNAITAGNSFTNQQSFTNGSANWCCAIATRVLTGTATLQTSFTRASGVNTHNWIASFIESGGGGGATIYNRTIFQSPIFKSRVFN